MTTVLTDAEVGELRATKVADARGSACPGPLLEAKKAITGVPPGDVLELWSSDPNTKKDVEAWATKVGHEFIGFIEASGYDRVFVRRVK